MTRVKGGVGALKRRRNVLKKAKGFRFGRSTKERQAKEALLHAGEYAFAHRRDKKRDFRALFQVQINAVARQHGVSYSKFIDMLKKKKIGLNRKMLADLAENNPQVFEKIVTTARA